MGKYIIKRLLMLIPVLLGVSIIVFTITHVFSPDPAAVVLGQHATEESMEAWREANGLTGSVISQFGHYILGVLQGDLGTSYYTKVPVTEELASRFPATIELAVIAIILASIFGVLLGVLSAVKKNSALDNAGRIISLVGVSVPIFWLGVIMIIIFSGTLHWLPSGGQIDPLLKPARVTGFNLLDCIIAGNGAAVVDSLKHIIMPALALCMYALAIITRITRTSMLDSMKQDYVRTAKAKGLSEGKVLKKHVLRNSLNPVVTIIGLQFGSLLGGAVLTEKVFSWPGIGSYIVDCVQKSDFPVIQGAVLLTATIFVVVNLVVDIVYTFLDPRIKLGKKEA
ncbi:ABC transporter permease [Luxibacter massiliensis]|uniref:ABC transporter permease n=1 Tax=Luxibacter massiliensis TaxID=2219695 RepID=UPI000F0565DE|nr:ABC transporter permease [Luxibacter massiliensis]